MKNQKRLGIAALADAEGFSKEIVANAGTQLLFEGDVTIATKLAEVTKAFVGEYGDIVDGAIGNKAEQLAASAAKVQIEGSKLKATWNARATLIVKKNLSFLPANGLCFVGN